jgi:hypothetical protein
LISIDKPEPPAPCRRSGRTVGHAAQLTAKSPDDRAADALLRRGRDIRVGGEPFSLQESLVRLRLSAVWCEDAGW